MSIKLPETHSNYPSNDKPDTDSLGDRPMSLEHKSGVSEGLSGDKSQQGQTTLVSELGCGVSH